MKDTNRGSSSVTRREALKTLGAGAALMGLGMVSTRALAADSPAGPVPSTPTSPSQPFVLPKLGYAATDLIRYRRVCGVHFTAVCNAGGKTVRRLSWKLPDARLWI